MKQHKLPKKVWPILVLSGLIQIWALVDILQSGVFIRGNKPFWVAMVFVLPPFGALAYYVLGREAF